MTYLQIKENLAWLFGAPDCPDDHIYQATMSQSKLIKKLCCQVFFIYLDQPGKNGKNQIHTIGAKVSTRPSCRKHFTSESIDSSLSNCCKLSRSGT